MRIPRRNPELNDAIEILDQYYIASQNNVAEAWTKLSPDELIWVDKEIEKALDLRYYLENYHTIKTEKNIVKTLFPFWDHQEIVYEAMQEEFEEKGECNLIVLKPRQTGLSVWTAASMFHRTIFFPHMFTMIVAQDIKTNTHLYNMCLNAYYLLPWWMRPEYLYKTKTGAIEFQRTDEKVRGIDPGLGSMIQVSPANQMSGVAIGRSITNLHLSEVSRYPDNGLYEADIKPSTRSAQHGMRIMESTARGRNGLFYEQWCGAVDGETEFRAVFIPVYKVKKYYVPIHGPFDLADDEKTFNERIKREEHFEIPDEFWNFRRQALRGARRMGTKADFLECYPLTPAEAFQSSGLGAFDPDSIEWQQMNKICKPLYAGEITLLSIDKGANTGDIRPVREDEILPRRKSGRGGMRLHIWEMPERGANYYCSADIALGNGGDYTSIQVFRAGEGLEPDTQVASWLGWIPPKRAAHVIAAIGLFYNSAEVACEYAKDGITTANELRDMDYPNLYRPQFKDRLTNQASNYLHWYTNSKTRDEIIGCMNEALLDRSVVIRDADLLDEMIDFASVDGDRIQGQGNEDDQCFPEGTLIDTLSGPRAIETLTDTDTVLSDDGYEHKIKWVGHREVDEDIVQVSIFGLDSSIRCTGNHPILARRRRPQRHPICLDLPTWIPAKEIRKNDFVFVPIRKLPTTTLSDDILYLLGWYLADGHASGKTGHVSFCLSPEDDESRLVGILKTIADTHRTTALRGNGKKNGKGRFTWPASKVRVSHYGTFKRVAVGNRWLKEFLHMACGPARRKYIHPAILNSVGTMQIVQGFLEGDGSQKNRRGSITVSQRNHALVRGIHRILLDHGVWSSIHPKKDKNGLLILSICGEWVNKFVDLCPTSAYRKVVRELDHPIARFDGDGFWAQVKSTERVPYKGAVWNMEVEDSHTYLVNGVAVHNCMSSMIGLYCLRETMKHLKTAAVAEDKTAGSGESFIYGLYDNLMRQRGQYNTKAEAERAKGDTPGWSVRAIPVTNANTLFSPIFDQMGAEFELRNLHGLHSTEITPDIVWAYRSAMDTFRGAGQQQMEGDDW